MFKHIFYILFLISFRLCQINSSYRKNKLVGNYKNVVNQGNFINIGDCFACVDKGNQFDCRSYQNCDELDCKSSVPDLIDCCKLFRCDSIYYINSIKGRNSKFIIFKNYICICVFWNHYGYLYNFLCL